MENTMTKVSLVYISLSGNTESFCPSADRLFAGAASKPRGREDSYQRLGKGRAALFEMDNPFIAFLPTYLEGGNGVDNGDVEILTTDVGTLSPMVRMPASALGVIGSGNRNFNNQYCLTAKQYSERFRFPVLADF